MWRHTSQTIGHNLYVFGTWSMMDSSSDRCPSTYPRFFHRKLAFDNRCFDHALIYFLKTTLICVIYAICACFLIIRRGSFLTQLGSSLTSPSLRNLEFYINLSLRIFHFSNCLSVLQSRWVCIVINTHSLGGPIGVWVILSSSHNKFNSIIINIDDMFETTRENRLCRIIRNLICV